MPLPIKLSRRFYDALGDEVANELVTLLSALDDSYRAEHRELVNGLRRLEARMDQLEARMQRLEERMPELVERRVAEQLSQMEKRWEDRLNARLADLKLSLLIWTFLFWLGTMGTVVALLKL